jgi:hypothetical protein
MNRRYFKILFLIGALGSSLWAQNGARLYTNAFLEIPLGARAAGMGSAFAAVANDGTAFFWNPAGVAMMHRREVSVMYLNQFDGMAQYNFIGYTHQLSKDYGFSVAWIRYSVGNIPETSALGDTKNDRGNPNYNFTQYFHGQFNYTDNALFFTFAKMNSFKLNLGWAYTDFPIQIPVGINFKIIDGGTSGISGQNSVVTKDVTKSGIGVDVGSMLMFSFNDLTESSSFGDFALALHIQDATTTNARYNAISSAVSTQDIAKANFKFGMSYIQPFDQIQSNLLISYESNSRYGGDQHWGMEYTYRRMVAFRMGLDSGSLTYGAGVALWQFHLDYALATHALGYTHRISMAYKF